MELTELLIQLKHIVDEGVSVPFSDKVLLDRDKVLRIIELAVDILPEEIKEARRINEEKNRILVEAEKQADLIIKEAEERINSLVEDNEITRRAYQQAEEIIENAKENAREIRLGTKEYVDNLLVELENFLKNYLGLVAKNREEVRNMRS